MLIDDLKFAGQNASRVYVARVRLDRFVIAENLGCRRRWHGSEKQAVTKPKTKKKSTIGCDDMIFFFTFRCLVSSASNREDPLDLKRPTCCAEESNMQSIRYFI